MTDPLGGEEALCVQGKDGVEHLEQFWVDARAKRCHLPARTAGDANKAPSGSGPSRDMVKAMESVENRLRQTVQALEDLRKSYHLFLSFVGMLAAVGVIFWAGTYVYNTYIAGNKPQISNLPDSPVPVKTREGQWVWVKPIIVTEQVAPQLQASLKDSERQAYEAEKATLEQKSAPPTSGPATAPTNPTTTTEAGHP